MLLVAFFGWWYGAGWQNIASGVGRQITDIYHEFSVPMLLTTLFQPWRRIVSPPGTGLSAHARAAIDNLVSRAVGSTVRLLTLIAAAIFIVVVAVGGVALTILWPFLPPACLAFVVWGLL